MDALRKLLSNHNLPEEAIGDVVSEVQTLIAEQTKSIRTVTDAFCCPFCLEIVQVNAITDNQGNFVSNATCARCKTKLVVKGRKTTEIIKISEDVTGS